MGKFLSSTGRYGAAALVLLAATWLRLLLDPLLGEYAPFPTFLAGIAIAAWFFGIGPAILVLVGSAFAAVYLFVPPQGMPLPGRAAQWTALAAFLGIGVAFVLLIDTVRQARIRAEISERHFRRLLEAGNVGIAMVDESGAIQYANQALLKLLGYTAEEVRAGQLRWDRITASEYAAVTPAVFRQVEQTGGATLPPPYEKVYITRDGRRVPVLIGLVPFERRPDGAGVGAAFVIDLTPVQEAEAALRVSEERLRLAAQATMFGLYDIDLVSGECFWSPELKSILGVSADPAERAGAEIPGRLHPDDQVRYRLDVAASRNPGGTGDRHGEYRVVRPDGAVRWIAITGKTHYAGAKGERRPVRAVGAVLDITAHRQNEERLLELNRVLCEREASLRRANAELQQFASIASHDLKAPLRAVHQLSTVIEEELAGSLSVEGRCNLRLLRERVGRMDTLINALLDYSRAGGRVERLECVDSAELVAEIARAHELPERFTVEATQDLPRFETDRLHLQQVFANLIENAIQYHHRRDGHVWVTARDEGLFYRFIVADDGPGIPPEYQQRIFEMFQRGPDTQGIPGTGIGLAVVKKVVEGLGGEVRLESVPGQGSRFEFTWPKQLRLPEDAILPAGSRNAPGHSVR